MCNKYFVEINVKKKEGRGPLACEKLQTFGSFPGKHGSTVARIHGEMKNIYIYTHIDV